MADVQARYKDITQKTAADLKKIAQSLAAQDVSHLSLPEVNAVSELVAQIVPAGNVPGIILSGLGRLSSRKGLEDTARRDINLLFKGVEQVLDAAVYGTFFAGPAAVLWGYQNILKLAGKNPADFFPEGTWQFYVEYALREDTARHATETHGFDTLLNTHNIQLCTVDRITAWVMTAIHCLHQYPNLLKNEWRERVYLHILQRLTQDAPDAAYWAGLYHDWEKLRPYGRSHDAAPDETYPAYRARKFDEFLEKAMESLAPELRRQWVDGVHAAKDAGLPNYQRQMSILAYLAPDTYSETRTPIHLNEAHIGLIVQGRYHLIPVCAPGGKSPAEFNAVRDQVAECLTGAAGRPLTPLRDLTRLRRSAWPKASKRLSSTLREELDALHYAPIIFNTDRRERGLPLAELRQAERGIGCHALTLLDTGETIVFDMSHIFFDGAWGAALAEIMTNEALAWGVYASNMPDIPPTNSHPTPLNFHFQPADRETIQNAPHATTEASAETQQANVQAMLGLRKLFKRRNDLISLTVNDILILYRAIHAVTYQPDPKLVAALEELQHQTAGRAAARSALDVIEPAHQVSPAILIPVDASQASPRDRLYPLNFDVPLQDLDLLRLHRNTTEALIAYKAASGERGDLYAQFDRLQRTYLATLVGFGEMLDKAKRIALAGEDPSMGVLKLVATLPAPVQRVLEQIPRRFEMLNDIIRGREVFSNVGAVVKTSSLTRFITAKDDNEQKTLAWGAITDAEGVMLLSLRDFRPYVGLLESIGRKDLAAWIAQDYLDTYARGLNAYIHDLWQITLASRETRLE